MFITSSLVALASMLSVNLYANDSSTPTNIDEYASIQVIDNYVVVDTDSYGGFNLRDKVQISCVFNYGDDTIRYINLASAICESHSDNIYTVCAYNCANNNTYFFVKTSEQATGLYSTTGAFVYEFYRDEGGNEYINEGELVDGNISFKFYISLLEDEELYNFYEGRNPNYETGYSDGYESGHAEGVAEGEDIGYTDGYNTGYQNGYNQGLLVNSSTDFMSLFGAIADTPIMMFRRLFGFELFGESMIAVVMTLFTFIVLIKVVKAVFK